MSKPIAIVPVGNKFKVQAYGQDVVRTLGGKLDVTREGHNVEGKTALFAYSMAETVAHKVGRYFFNLGDFIDAYVDGLKK